MTATRRIQPPPRRRTPRLSDLLTALTFAALTATAVAVSIPTTTPAGTLAAPTPATAPPATVTVGRHCAVNPLSYCPGETP